jgi:predicted RNA binding protein YcfA (HicA-like mRNA interferase family)
MTKKQKLVQRLIVGSKNVRFSDLQQVAEGYGFILLRVTGSHHIYSHPGLEELINLQDVNGQAKPYQIKQFLKLVEKYDLRIAEEE